ncbi:MAG: carboxypeptidase regulatory-like domain-containing protein [Candidatus Acidiferrales bacterium]
MRIQVSERAGFIVFLTLVLCSFASPLWSQTGGTGALTVTVTDPSGAVIPDASVTVTNSAGLSRSATTSANGSCTFTLLPVGDYIAKISAKGFTTVDVPSVTINVTETHLLTQKMTVGSVAQEVTVSTAVQAVQTESVTLGGVVGNSVLTDLPLVTRNYTQIMGLSPGVVTDVNNASSLGRGSKDVYVNGGANQSNTYEMDGANVTSVGEGTPQDSAATFGSIPIPSPDAIQEFKVQTGQFDASYGQNSGANVNVVTKSGTNDFHGSLFEFFRNDALNANGFFQNLAEQPRGKLEGNQFGGTVGGPVRKDKLFFFLSYQGTRQINGVAVQGFQTANLPEQLTDVRTAAALGSEFCPANNPIGSSGARFAHTQFGGTEVACDGSNINSVALALLQAKLPNGSYVIPSPQTILNPGTPSAIGFSSYSVPATFKEDQALLNIDWQISPKNSLELKYFYAYAPQVWSFNCTGCLPYTGGNVNLSGNQFPSLKLTTLLTNNLVNEFHLSYYWLRASADPTDPITPQQVGMTTATSSWNTFLPVININGLVNFGGFLVDGSKDPSKSYEGSDQLSWSHGRHTIRVGADVQQTEFHYHFYGVKGQLTFLSWADFLIGESAAQNGTPFSNVFNSFSYITQPGGTTYPMREWRQSSFAQDDFKVSRQLTLNLGLRWEHDGQPADASPNAGIVNYNLRLLQALPIPPVSGTYVGLTVANNYTGPMPTGIVPRGKNCQSDTCAPYFDFAPRIGFAWQPIRSSSRLVVRGGYGIFYNIIDSVPYVIGVTAVPPTGYAFSVSGASNALATLALPFNPIPVLPGFSSALRTPTSQISQSSVAYNLRTPYTMTYNLDLQWEFKPSWIADIGYVGSNSHNVETAGGYNEPLLASPTDPVNCGDPVTGCITTNTAANAASRVPILGFSPTGLTFNGNIAAFEYNALQVMLKTPSFHGLYLQASYTWGRDFTNVTGVDLSAGGAGSAKSNDPNNLRQQWGLADYTRPQRFVVNYTYRFPDYHNGERFADKALSGWNVSGVTVVQDGLPLTLTDSTGGAVYGFAGTSRAQLCPGFTVAQIKNPGGAKANLNNYFNLDSVADTSAHACSMPVLDGVAGATIYGNTRRSILLGPGQFNWDFAIAKRTTVGGLREDAYLEFRTEFFNTFNHTQFTNPATSVSGATFGVISSASVGPRIMQFALRYAF